MRRLRSIARLVIALAAPATLVGCRDDTVPGPAAALKEPFFISGAITETGQPWGYRVKGEPGTSYRVTEVYFKIAPATLILREDGTRADPADLIVGRKITLWITGAIAESYPPQVGARLIVLK